MCAVRPADSRCLGVASFGQPCAVPRWFRQDMSAITPPVPAPQTAGREWHQPQMECRHGCDESSDEDVGARHALRRAWLRNIVGRAAAAGGWRLAGGWLAAGESDGRAGTHSRGGCQAAVLLARSVATGLAEANRRQAHTAHCALQRFASNTSPRRPNARPTSPRTPPPDPASERARRGQTKSYQRKPHTYLRACGLDCQKCRPSHTTRQNKCPAGRRTKAQTLAGARDQQRP